MAPKLTKANDLLENEIQTHLNKVREWSDEFQSLGLFIDNTGTQSVINVDGRDTDLFSVTGLNARGHIYIIQVWGVNSFATAEYFK